MLAAEIRSRTSHGISLMSYNMKYICIYCGSSDRSSTVYRDAAVDFAETLCDRDIGLIYGGATSGVMGTLADAVLDSGGTVTGVIPETLLDVEEPHPGLTELITTPTKDERKQRMAELADGFVALPGGIGTQEEILTSLGQAKHGRHEKPCGFLNVNGYYDSLVSFFDNATNEGFVSEEQRDLFLVAETPNELFNLFDEYQSPVL